MNSKGRKEGTWNVKQKGIEGSETKVEKDHSPEVDVLSRLAISGAPEIVSGSKEDRLNVGAEEAAQEEKKKEEKDRVNVGGKGAEEVTCGRNADEAGEENNVCENGGDETRSKERSCLPSPSTTEPLSSQKEANVVFDGEAQSSFRRICAEFRAFHSHPFNVFAHFITTPLALLAVFALMGPGLTLPLSAVYLVSLIGKVPFNLWLFTFALTTLSAVAASIVAPRALSAALLFIVAYGAQDLAHIIAGESTYQSSYEGKPARDFLIQLMEHTYYLVPLLLDTALFHNSFRAMGRWFLAENRVLRGKITGAEEVRWLLVFSFALVVAPLSSRHSF